MVYYCLEYTKETFLSPTPGERQIIRYCSRLSMLISKMMMMRCKKGRRMSAFVPLPPVASNKCTRSMKFTMMLWDQLLPLDPVAGLPHVGHLE
jgi:hypothetical protein